MRHEKGAFFDVLHGHPFAEPAACHQFLDSFLGYDLQSTILTAFLGTTFNPPFR